MLVVLVAVILNFDNNHYQGIATSNIRRYDYNIF